PPPMSPLCPYTTLFRSGLAGRLPGPAGAAAARPPRRFAGLLAGLGPGRRPDRVLLQPAGRLACAAVAARFRRPGRGAEPGPAGRSEEHTSELQSRENLV